MSMINNSTRIRFLHISSLFSLTRLGKAMLEDK